MRRCHCIHQTWVTFVSQAQSECLVLDYCQNPTPQQDARVHRGCGLARQYAQSEGQLLAAHIGMELGRHPRGLTSLPASWFPFQTLPNWVERSIHSIHAKALMVLPRMCSSRWSQHHLLPFSHLSLTSTFPLHLLPSSGSLSRIVEPVSISKHDLSPYFAKI